MKMKRKRRRKNEKISFKILGALALVAFLSGCGGDGESEALAIIEPSTISLTNRIEIQLKDNNTIIKDMIINKGNCAVLRYNYVSNDEAIAKDLLVSFTFIRKAAGLSGTIYDINFVDYEGNTHTIKNVYYMYKASSKISDKAKLLEDKKFHYWSNIGDRIFSWFSKNNKDKNISYRIFSDDSKELQKIAALDERVKSHYKITDYFDKKAFLLVRKDFFT